MHSHSQHSRSRRSGRAGGWPDAAVARIAADQRANVSHAQLLGLGISPSAIKRAAARRRLHRVHHGVYSLVPSRARPALAAEHAAILAAGPGAVLSHASAARLHGIAPATRGDRGVEGVAVHVTVAPTRRHSRPGIVVHRTADLPPAEHHRLHGLPVTSVARTVVDLAPTCNPPQLAALIDRALKRTSRSKLSAAADRHPRRPGVPLLIELLDPARPSADVWSHAEHLLLQRIGAAGIPLPEANVPVGPYVVDLLWREQCVIAEFDSAEHHSGPAAQRWDTARHNHLTSILDCDVIHVTWDELTRHTDRLLVQIAVAVSRGRR